MTLVIMQCPDCENDVHWLIPETVEEIKNGEIGWYVCKAYPDRIPNYVEEATDSCPKYSKRKK